MLKNIILKAGAGNVSGACSSDNRLRVNIQDDGNDYCWYNRTVVKKDKFTFGFLTAYNLGKKVLQKNHLLATYTHNGQHSLYFRAENDGYRKVNPTLNDPQSFFDNLIVDYVNNIDSKSKAAVEVQNKIYLGLIQSQTKKNIFSSTCLPTSRRQDNLQSWSK